MSNTTEDSFSNKYFISAVILLSITLVALQALLNDQLNQPENILIIILLLSFIIIAGLNVYWIKGKLTFESDNVLRNTGSLPKVYLLVSGIYFASFFILTVLVPFTWYNQSNSQAAIANAIMIFFITINNLIIIFHFNAAFSQTERPNAYLFQFLNRKINKITNNYQTSFSIKLIFIFVIFILPFVILFIITKDMVTSYFILSILIGAILGGYWLGYGLYKHFIWIWGFQPGPNNSTTGKKQRLTITDILKHFKYREGKFVTFGFGFLLFSIVLIISLVFKVILPNLEIPVSLLIFVLLVYVICLYGIIINITGKRTQSQPWYSLFFTMFSYSIPFYIIFSLYYSLSAIHLEILTNSVLQIIPTKDLFGILLIITIIVALSINNTYLRVGIWRNNYESTQLLSVLKIDPKNPSVIKLTLLQKIGNSMEDRETILKLIVTYQDLLESNQEHLKDEFIAGLYNFINYQLSFDSDDETYELLFNLANLLLDQHPNWAGTLFEKNLELLKSGNSVVKNGSLNVLGHILQINQDKVYVSKIYDEIEKIYSTNDEKLKRLILDALLYISNNYPEYAYRIKDLISPRLEYETFGISTLIFSVLDEVYQATNDEEIYITAKKVLKSLDSPAKLGAINFLRNNFPKDQEELKECIDIFLQNLKDIDNAIGVRTNIIYAINDLIKINPSKSTLLAELNQYMDDSDPDVRSAIIQTYSEQYILQNAQIEDVTQIFSHGMKANDYVVRLVVLQSLKSIKNETNKLEGKLKTILEKALVDESQIIQDEAKTLLAEN